MLILQAKVLSAGWIGKKQDFSRWDHIAQFYKRSSEEAHTVNPVLRHTMRANKSPTVFMKFFDLIVFLIIFFIYKIRV